MRQKKSNLIYYIIGAAVLLALVILALVVEIPVDIEQVEEIV